jgi:hypothetical protein
MKYMENHLSPCTLIYRVIQSCSVIIKVVVWKTFGAENLNTVFYKCTTVSEVRRLTLVLLLLFWLSNLF